MTVIGLKLRSHSRTQPSRPPVAKPSSQTFMLKIPDWRKWKAVSKDLHNKWATTKPAPDTQTAQSCVARHLFNKIYTITNLQLWPRNKGVLYIVLLECSTEGLLWINVFTYTKTHLIQPTVRHLVVQKAGMNMHCSHNNLPHHPIPSPSCWSNRYHLILWSKRLILFYWAESNAARVHGFDPGSVYEMASLRLLQQVGYAKSVWATEHKTCWSYKLTPWAPCTVLIRLIPFHT